MTKRERLYPEIKRLRDEGLTFREIGERFGISTSTVHDYHSDPTAEKVRARKANYRGACVDCGGPTSYTVGRSSERCGTCAGKYQRTLTRAWVLESIREWHQRFGAPPTPHDWNPALCRSHMAVADDCYARALARHQETGRPWPPTSTLYNHFTSWPAALREAGLEPLKPNERWIGHRGMQLRRDDEVAA